LSISPGLNAVRARAHIEVVVRPRYLELLEENGTEPGIVMLATVDGRVVLAAGITLG
jgi:hypothetical protein